VFTYIGMWDYRWGDQQWWPRPIAMYGTGNVSADLYKWDVSTSLIHMITCIYIICMHIYEYTYIFVSIYISVYIYVYIAMHGTGNVSADLYKWDVSTCVCICKFMDIDEYIYTCIYT
jgi:hypothetical protein